MSGLLKDIRYCRKHRRRLHNLYLLDRSASEMAVIEARLFYDTESTLAALRKLEAKREEPTRQQRVEALQQELDKQKRARLAHLTGVHTKLHQRMEDVFDVKKIFE